MGSGNASGGYRARNSRRRPRPGVMNEINVTPLVDVMLVLLIVFMVSAPLMTTGVAVELPKTSAKQLSGDNEPITLSIKSDRSIYLNKEPITLEALVAKLQAVVKGGYDQQIMVRADRDVDYGSVMQLMGSLNGAGYKKIGLVTQSAVSPPSVSPPSPTAPKSD